MASQPLPNEPRDPGFRPFLPKTPAPTPVLLTDDQLAADPRVRAIDSAAAELALQAVTLQAENVRLLAELKTQNSLALTPFQNLVVNAGATEEDAIKVRDANKVVIDGNWFCMFNDELAGGPCNEDGSLSFSEFCVIDMPDAFEHPDLCRRARAMLALAEPEQHPVKTKHDPLGQHASSPYKVGCCYKQRNGTVMRVHRIFRLCDEPVESRSNAMSSMDPIYGADDLFMELGEAGGDAGGHGWRSAIDGRYCFGSKSSACDLMPGEVKPDNTPVR